MNFYEIVKNYPKQFLYNPEVIGNIKEPKYFIICGMGGSHLVGDILKSLYPNIFVHKNYGLPNLPKEILKNSLIIIISHSGNTEETINSFLSALKNKLNLLVISTNGKLLRLAKKYKTTYIEIPGKEIQPRLALGYHLKAILKIVDLKIDISFLSRSLEIEKLEEQGKKLLKKLKNKIPIIYSSEKNEFLAYNFKIKFNETSKIPAFCNVFPELNHNEMQGNIRRLNKNFAFIFLEDKNDYPRVQKRIEVLEKIFREKKLEVIKINLDKISKLSASNPYSSVIRKNPYHTFFHKIFSSLILGDFLSYFLAKYYREDPEKVEIVEKFKSLIK